LETHPLRPLDEERSRSKDKRNTTMDPIDHLALSSSDNAKLTPLGVLADFADATQGWVYLARASRHYADEKDRPGLVVRHWRKGTPNHVDFAFAVEPSADDTVRLVVLDAPDVEGTLSRDHRAELLETFLAALRKYLGNRPDHVTLHVERNAASLNAA